jgi:hypothetical protein
VELPEIKKIQMQDLDRWFSTLSDGINYNLQEIEKALPASLGADKNLSTIDTPPIQYLKNALDGLVDNLNKNLGGLSSEFAKMDKRIKSLEDAITKKGA